MNYRHAFHAGSFADVIKHIVLARIVTYLQDKPGAFRVIDTHAGAGLYDLESDEARRGGEWLTGIARLMQARFSNDTIALTKPYLDIVRAYNPKGELKAYPGSPLIARALMRPQDRLVACELEPKARKALIGVLRHDEQARVVDLDGWMALPAFVPPKERRGLVLIDPPFEAKDEFDKLGEALLGRFREMADRYLCNLVSRQEPARHRRAGAISGAPRSRSKAAGKLPAPRIQCVAASRRRNSHLHRALDRQSALHAAGRAQDDPARAGNAARPGWRCQIPIRGAEALTLRHSWEKYARAVVNLQRTVLCCFRDWLYVPLPRMVAAE
ncbi:23S rRNA A2030 N6-methylase RlmJ [Bradyrhizobium sp. LB7.2]